MALVMVGAVIRPFLYMAAGVGNPTVVRLTLPVHVLYGCFLYLVTVLLG